MPRLTNNSLISLAHSVPTPSIFPDLTLSQISNQLSITGNQVSVSHDLLLVCLDGVVSTNQCVMAAASSFMKKLLADCHVVEAGRTGRKEEMVTMHLAEMDCVSVNRVVTCFTEGVVKVPLKGGWGVKEKLEAAWRVMGIDKVGLEEIFKNVQASEEVIDIVEDLVKTEDVMGDFKKESVIDDVPDRLLSLCATGIISVGGERKRKVNDVREERTFSGGLENNRNQEVRNDSKEINKMGNVASRSPKRRRGYDQETVIPVEDNFSMKSEPVPHNNTFGESVSFKSELPTPVNLTTSNESVTKKSSAKGRSRGRPKKSTDSVVLPPPSSILTPQPVPQNEPTTFQTQSFIKPEASNLSFQPPLNPHPQPQNIRSQSSHNLQPVQPSQQGFSQPATLSKEELAEKKAKIDRTPFALEPFTCFVCLKTKDKDGRVLNMKNLFYLRNHFAKCLYNEGKVFSAVPPGAENTEEDGRPKDEFGLKNGFMYKCNVAGCWLQMKKGTHSQVCYKVYAIHMVSQHGVMEKLLEEDDRQEPHLLLRKVRAYENCEVEPESPRKANTVVGNSGWQEPAPKVSPGGQVFQRNSSAWKSASVQELLVAEEENPDDPDDPAELSEIVRPSEDTSVFKRVNPSVNSSILNMFKPPEKRLEPTIITPPTPLISGPIQLNQRVVPNQPSLTPEGFHTCFLCNGLGKNNKDAHHLSFKNLMKLKEHYARCVYNEGNMHRYVSPGEDNMDREGKPIDEYGKTNGKMYKCQVQGCWLQKKLGLRGHVCYKVYSIHMASQHGVLEIIMEEDDRPFMKELLRGIKKEEGEKATVIRCRFEACKDMQFKLAANKRELKMHYATQHFRSWFETRDKKGLDRMPTLEFSSKAGTRATCHMCSEETKKPIYVQGDNDAIMGHLVVKHDLLVEALREAGDSFKETKDVVKDLYPDQVTEFYMATLSNQGAVPLNEDFMVKMFI